MAKDNGGDDVEEEEVAGDNEEVEIEPDDKEGSVVKQEVEAEPDTTRDQLRELGFYDNEFSEFPPELSGVKRFKVEGNAEPLIEALQLTGLDITFMKKELVEALGRIGDPVAVDVLTDNLRGDLQMDVFDALGRIGSAEATEDVADFLDPEKKVKPHVRAKAAETIGKIEDPEAIEVLAEALEIENSRVRGAVAQAIGEIGGEDAPVNELASLLDREDEYNTESVRLSAARALDRIGTDEAREALSDYRDDKNELVADVAG
ncbi:MAG: HEAT repeat domain-containing protein [Halobacteria archaeon]